MLRTILEPIMEDLERVFSLIKKEYPAMIEQAGDDTGLEYLSVNKAIRPALVILSSRMYGGNPEKTASLAVVFQFIYLASRVHNSISESESGPGVYSCGLNDGNRFPVLLGDYLYGRSTSILLDSGINGMIRELAEIVCHVHEGMILRRQLAGRNPAVQLYHDIIRKETAELFAACCSLGARLAGAPEADQENIRCFGQNLGMAYGMSKQGMAVKHVAYYAETAWKYLLLAPACTEKDILEKMVNIFSKSEIMARRMVG